MHSGNKVSLCGALGNRVTLPSVWLKQKQPLIGGLINKSQQVNGDSPQEIPDLLLRPTSLKRFAMAPVIPKLLVRWHPQAPGFFRSLGPMGWILKLRMDLCWERRSCSLAALLTTITRNSCSELNSPTKTVCDSWFLWLKKSTNNKNRSSIFPPQKILPIPIPY